jgi:hypothetical protein
MRRTIIASTAGLAVLAISVTGCKSGAHASTATSSPTAVVATQTQADATSAAPAPASPSTAVSPAGPASASPSNSVSGSGSASPSGAPASASASAAGNSDGSGAGASLPKDCPPAAEVSAAIGFTVPDPLPSSDADSLSCSYLTGGVNTVEINFQTTPSGTTAASLQAQLQAGAASGSTVAPVSGYGQAAFTTSGVAPGVGMLVLDSGVEFSVTGGTSIAGLENLAKKLLAG